MLGQPQVVINANVGLAAVRSCRVGSDRRSTEAEVAPFLSFRGMTGPRSCEVLSLLASVSVRRWIFEPDSTVSYPCQGCAEAICRSAQKPTCTHTDLADSRPQTEFAGRHWQRPQGFAWPYSAWEQPPAVLTALLPRLTPQQGVRAPVERAAARPGKQAVRVPPLAPAAARARPERVVSAPREGQGARRRVQARPALQAARPESAVV